MKEKFTKDLEKDFQNDLGEEKIKAARDVSIAAAVIYSIFGIVDLMFAPSLNIPAWIIRLTVLFMTLSVIYVTIRKSSFFLRQYNTIIIFEYFIFGLGVQGIAISSPPDHMSWQNYHPSLILITFALYTTTYLNSVYAVSTGLALIGSYIFTSIYFEGITQINNTTHIISNIVFLLSTNAVALISKNIMQRFSRSAFLLKQDLLKDLSQRMMLEEKLRKMATRDMLTGTYNRWRFMEMAEHEFKRHSRNNNLLCFIMADLDNFKTINDTYGHYAGDKTLQLFSNICLEQLRDSDVICRYGGEEFLFLLPETSFSDAFDISERIRKIFESRSILFNHNTIKSTVSMGISTMEKSDPCVEDIILRADQALYDAKRSGKNIVKIANHISRNQYSLKSASLSYTSEKIP
ncbi:MAG: GGDEF domain-containing protein [Spirochaetia bacterium]|nr:GGDEF domain-containing protein [Spirochaetia bacterium]